MRQEFSIGLSYVLQGGDPLRVYFCSEAHREKIRPFLLRRHLTNETEASSADEGQ